MVLSIAVNGVMMFVYMVCVLYTIGDVNKVMNSPTGLPLIEVYYQVTKNRGATNFLVFMMMFVVVLSLFNMFASVSRLIWSFAYDKGLPFHRHFARVNSNLEIPLNALLLVGVICALLALIPIGSSIAFYALVSLPLIGLNISYFFPILFIMIRKLRGRHPTYGPFKLGHWGIPVNLLALCYILYVLSFVALPPFRPVTAKNFNYAGPLMLVVICLALADWVISGRRRFSVPVPRGLRRE
jgi:amino acid transporter